MLHVNSCLCAAYYTVVNSNANHQIQSLAFSELFTARNLAQMHIIWLNQEGIIDWQENIKIIILWSTLGVHSPTFLKPMLRCTHARLYKL